MVRCIERYFSNALERLYPDRASKALVGAVGIADHLGVLELELKFGPQPVVVVVPRRIGLELELRPRGQRPREIVLGGGYAVGLRDARMATRQQRFGGVVERAEQRALPAGPNPRAHGADVAGREDHQQCQPLRRLHDIGEGAGGFGVLQVACLGDFAHRQMVLDQPGDGIGLGRVEPEPRAEFAGDAGAGDRMVLRPPLGDIVQEQRDIKQPRVIERR